MPARQFPPFTRKVGFHPNIHGGANTLLVAQRPEERLFTWCIEEIFFSKPNRFKKKCTNKEEHGQGAQNGQSSPGSEKMRCM